MKKLAIRADGGKNIGMGHIMRCMALAKEFIKRDIEVLFVTKKVNEVNEILNDNNINYINIECDNLDDEIIEFKNITEENNIDSVITDSYWLNNNYLMQIKKIVKTLISIDDNNLYNYPSDFIINGNIYARDLNYKVFNDNQKFLLGCDYTILRDEFKKNFDYTVNKKVKNILVTMGGSDINNFTPFVIESIKNLDVNINVIVGKTFNCINELEVLAKKHNNINLIYNPKNISEIMKRNDLAISASGSTTYELGVIGVPSIIIVQAKNQENIAYEFDKLNMMISLGYFDKINKDGLLELTTKLINNYEKRKNMSNLTKSFISKNGVKNIVDKILKEN